MSTATELIEKGAVLSSDGVYRYRLWRTWDPRLPVLTWAMLNPSTADADVDDPTIRRCMGFARREGYGGIEVVNLYGLRATDPKELLGHPDPEGPENLAHWASVLAACEAEGDELVAGWGAFRTPQRSIPRALEALCTLRIACKCLGTTKSGTPRHPLFLPSDRSFEPFYPWLSRR